MITVQLLGGASLRSGDDPLTGPPAQRHRIALLTLIIASWPQPLSRDRAMALLWPERDLSSSRRLLNLAVHVLRAALGECAIASTGDGLLLNPAHVSCDLVELRGAIKANDVERVARLYAGPLLDGFHLDESTDFAYWLDDRRSELTHAYVGALLALAERQEQCGDVHGRVGTCRRLVAVDPHSSVYALAMMRALDSAGDRAGARQHASDHAERLRTDLELPPDPEVIALAKELANAPVRRQPSPNAAGKARSPSVAVLPYAGGRVRIVAKFIDAASDRHLWAETYERQGDDMRSIQTDVAIQIATALQAELSRDELTLARREPTNVRGSQLFLQGRQWLTRYTPE